MSIGEYYAIEREKEFDEDCAKFAKNYTRLSQLDDAIDWLLMRNPTRFPQKDGFYFWRSDKLINFPTFFLVYKVDEQSRTVTLIGIEEIADLEE